MVSISTLLLVPSVLNPMIRRAVLIARWAASSSSPATPYGFAKRLPVGHFECAVPVIVVEVDRSMDGGIDRVEPVVDHDIVPYKF